MNATTLPAYLIGSRRAILDIAASKWSIWIGVIFVLSAGLAREYDGEDLLHEPWHALRPLGASLASGTLLFFLVYRAAVLKSTADNPPPGFYTSWKRFMGLFWLTAPMAWLYAVPYERFMSPVDAVEFNLWTLAAVALWRVLLMTRVIHVVCGIRHIYAFFLVMVFADAVVFAVVTLVPTPVIDIMSGIRQSERDALLASVTFMVTIYSVLTAPLWIIGALVSAGLLRPNWPSLPEKTEADPPRGLLILAGLSIVAFVPLLVVSQPEQINRREVEHLFARGEIAEAFAEMSSHTIDDYPPQWEPPPKVGYGESSPSTAELRDAMIQHWPADWVATLYLDKIDRKLQQEVFPHWYGSWADILESIDRRSPDGLPSDLVNDEQRSTARFLHEHHTGLSDADRQALERLATPPLTADSAQPDAN